MVRMQRRLLLVALCLGACRSEPIAPGDGAATPPSSGARLPGVDSAGSSGDGAPVTGGTPGADEDPAGAVAGLTPSTDADGSGGVAGTPSADAGSSGADVGASSAPDAGVRLAPGSLAVSWMHGAPSCAQSTDPELQVHAYNATTYILRQDKCRTFEAPFVYLLLGAQTALLLDTGATNSVGLRDTVLSLTGARSLLVAHSHAHADHVASDNRFRGQPGTTVVGTSLAAVQQAFGFSPWPSDTAELDLGGRVLDVLAIPGHEQTHIALYDRETGLLLTGDTLYPGLLFITDWTTYRASVRRLAAFVASHPVSHVLGAHIEMTSTARINYPYQTVYQPSEHVLQLDAAHVRELDAALTALGASPPAGPVALDDFVIDPQ
jgi:glyoxylase-like metal-dependent hydrolase (beta-lactamase superfamily II)